MITFPNAKINIGLNITEKRADGFHNLETVFYPLHWSEPLEIISGTGAGVTFSSTGIAIDGDQTSNLCVRAYALLSKDYPLRPVQMHLHKVLPIGAGLGGGSADAAFTIKALNDMFQLQLNNETMQDYARKLGSDCAFFIENKPVFAFERGDRFQPINLDLSSYFITVVKPSIHVSTAEAYGGVKPHKAAQDLREAIQQPIEYWKNTIVNDFEEPIFMRYPALSEIKECLYKQGAVYAAMSGSGSCIYGFFESPNVSGNDFPGCLVWQGNL